jgi:hypothetical protein
VEATPGHGSLRRVLTSTPAKVAELAAALLALGALIFSDSVRAWLKDIGRAVWTDHPQRTLVVVALGAAVLGIALFRSHGRSRAQSGRVAELERNVEEMEAKLAAPRPADRELFRLFQEALSGELLNFLRQHYFANPWPGDALYELDEFVTAWDDAGHEFFDSELEDARVALLRTSDALVRKVGRESFPRRDGTDRQEVPPGWEFGDMAVAQRYSDSVEGLTQAARDVWNTHQRLTRLGRNKLEE